MERGGLSCPLKQVFDTAFRSGLTSHNLCRLYNSSASLWVTGWGCSKSIFSDEILTKVKAKNAVKSTFLAFQFTLI